MTNQAPIRRRVSGGTTRSMDAPLALGPLNTMRIDSLRDSAEAAVSPRAPGRQRWGRLQPPRRQRMDALGPLARRQFFDQQPASVERVRWYVAGAIWDALAHLAVSTHVTIPFLHAGETRAPRSGPSRSRLCCGIATPVGCDVIGTG